MATDPETALDPPALDLPALAAWFADHVAGSAPGEPLEAELISGGRSNLTFVVHQGGQEWVLRRPPLGHVLPSAHDMSREYTVLAALQDTDVPVPRVDALCTDPTVTGAPFYVMSRVDGVVLRTASDGAALTDEQAAQVSCHLVDVLARIHAVDWRAVGLGDFGRAEGYLERQLRRWSQQWEKSRTRDLPELDEVARRLARAVPPSPDATLVHGDYRLDNVMLARTPGMEALAVLDWEMSTIGDPLADLGLLMVYWADADDRFPPPSVSPQIDATGGFLTRHDLAERYAAASGRDVSALPFYVVLGYFKLAIILEGIHKRHAMGKTLGEGFESLGDEVPVLIAAALDLAERNRDGWSW
jgi:aminoglycoside phosphotransferase (APT) family kinase protein